MVNVKMATLSANLYFKTLKYSSKRSFYSFKKIMVGKAYFNFTIEQTNHMKQHFLQGVVFNISLVLISILSSTINDFLSKFHSLTKVWII